MISDLHIRYETLFLTIFHTQCGIRCVKTHGLIWEKKLLLDIQHSHFRLESTHPPINASTHQRIKDVQYFIKFQWQQYINIQQHKNKPTCRLLLSTPHNLHKNDLLSHIHNRNNQQHNRLHWNSITTTSSLTPRLHLELGCVWYSHIASLRPNTSSSH